VQRAPDLLSYIQEIVDNKKKNSLFVLTGSNNILLMKSVTQTLAGRSAIFTLLPFDIHEASEITKCTDALTSVLRGEYPRYLVNDGKIPEFFENYTTTYVERDVHQLLNIRWMATFPTRPQINTNLHQTVLAELPTATSWLETPYRAYYDPILS
jgi:predicted AAA+ superfamily ATPase